MIIRDLKVAIRQAEVFRQIDCYEDSDLYEEVLAEYNEIKEEILGLCDPVFLMEPGIVPPELASKGVPAGAPVLFALYSVGRGPSDYATRAFERGDYLKGMLADAMADSALFSLEKGFAPILKETCAGLKKGISRRLEAPQDIPMEAQRAVFEKTNARKLCGMEISSGYMLDPIKSNAVLYMLTDEKDVFLHQHNCRNCDRYDCKMRNIPDIPVRVVDGGKEYTVMVPERESVLEALIKRDSSFGAVCGGTGKCGKCKIRIREGYLPPNAFDRQHFSEEELEKGMRLSCRAFPGEPLTVELDFRNEKKFQILSDYGEAEKGAFAEKAAPEAAYGVAVDIGTTTVAYAVLGLESGRKMAAYTALNRQRNFGADVISRIKASTEGKKEELKISIRQDLSAGIQSVVKRAGIPAEKTGEVVIAGNTTMIHLLMGYDCKGLGEFPFTPVNIDAMEMGYRELLGDDYLSARVRILPGISTFVGGDIVSGLYNCDVDRQDSCSLLIDLGTNGEIALGSKDKLMVTSTAAGPAFEGGNLAWGVGSIEGAISSVAITQGEPEIQTIGGKPPIGICGTGVLEAVAELVRAELVDETGCLDEKYFDSGYPLTVGPQGETIVLTQQDVREIQLAKAAVRAGVETLFLRYGIEKEQVAHVYLAGGFGFSLDREKAIEIGMIPEEFAGKIKTVGNSSLGGAAKVLLDPEGWARVTKIGKKAKEINLSADKEFNRLYMESMYFERG